MFVSIFMTFLMPLFVIFIFQFVKYRKNLRMLKESLIETYQEEEEDLTTLRESGSLIETEETRV